MLADHDDYITTDFCASLLEKIKPLHSRYYGDAIDYEDEIYDQFYYVNVVPEVIKTDSDKLQEGRISYDNEISDQLNGEEIKNDNDEVSSKSSEDSDLRFCYDSSIFDELNGIDIAEAIKNDRDKLEELINGLHVGHLVFVRILFFKEYMSETKVGEVCIDKLDKIIEFARSGDKALGLVFELFISITLYDPTNKYLESVAPRLPDFLTLVEGKRELWLNEEILYYIVRMVWTVCKLAKEETVEHLIHKDLMLRVCNLVVKIYEEEPEYLQIYRKVDYLNFVNNRPNTNDCEAEGYTAILLISSLHSAKVCCTLGSERSSMLPESRIILPIVISILQKVSGEVEPDSVVISYSVVNILTNLITNLLGSKDLEDHKKIVTSRAIVYLLASSISGSNERLNHDSSYNLLAVELFFRYHDRTPARTWTNPQALAEILPTLVAIIDSKTLLEEDMGSVHTESGTVPVITASNDYVIEKTSIVEITYAEAAINLAAHYISSKGQEVDQPILDSDFVHTLLRFVEDNEESKNYHGFIRQVAGCFWALSGALIRGKSPNTCKILDPLKDHFIPRFASIVTSKRFPNKHAEFLACAEIPRLLFNMAKCENIDIMAIENKSRIFLSYIKVLKNSRSDSLQNTAARTLYYLAFYRGSETQIISQYVLDHFPSIWKRMRSPNRCIWHPHILKLTTLISPDIQFSKINQLTDLECLMVDWVATQEDPWDIPSIRTCWGILLQNSRGPLARYLKKATKKNTGKGVFGLKYLINVMVTYLDKDPVYSSKYMRCLTKFILETAKSDLPDSQSILLEDLVSPAMWLLGRVSDEQIVENVTEFVRVLREG